MLLLHVGAFHLDLDSKHTTPWHALTPATRLLCTLFFVFATALTPNGRWWTWAIYGAGLLILLFLSRVRLSVLMRRLAVEFVFVGVLLVGTLFRGGGQVIWSWGWFQITTMGLMILGSVVLKAALSLIMMNILVLTTSIPDLLQGLAVLRVPPLLIAILASMHRYLSVLVDEFSSMQRAAVSRNLMSNHRWQRLVVGNMIGSLFIRTYERGDRIHHAMLSRGYTGLPPAMEVHKRKQLDILALTLTVILTLLGQVIYLF
jgi:cobalt/nickel transport system permease protein